MIDRHNARYKSGEVSYFLRINRFADVTGAEFKSKFLNYQKSDSKAEYAFNAPEETAVPDSIDWRTKGAVFPVQDEGDCGASPVFSAVSFTLFDI